MRETLAERASLGRINECLLGFGADSVENINRLTALCGELLGADAAVYNRLANGVFSAVGQWNVPPDFNPVTPASGTLCGQVLSRPTGGPVILRNLSESPFAAGDPRIDRHGLRSYVGQIVKSGDRVLGLICALFRRDLEPSEVPAKALGIIASAVAVEEARLAADQVRARLADELRQAHKMEAVGHLAGGIAHDFNNTLTTIKGYVEMLREAAPNAEMKADAGEVLKAVDSAAALTHQLLAFGRRQLLVPKAIDLSETVRRTAGMLKRLIRENIRIILELPAEPVPVHADPTQLEQVLINLALNARDAMPGGGTLTLRTWEASAEEVPPGEDGRPSSGPFVGVSVADTGIGISPEMKSRIFEPFFTMKAKGTGLGLSMAYGIVTQSGGKIRCESSPGQGAVFQIWLPRCEKKLTDAAQTLPFADLSGRGTVLLVEDDPPIRTVFERALKTAGYNVLAAGDAETALALARRPGESVDALVTDVMMPGLSGRQLALTLEKGRPGLKILYMSGYTDDAAFRSAMRPGIAFLQKPFSPSDLCRRLKELLA